MKRNLEAIAGKEFDLAIVGGGIFGVAAAWEAVSRGLSVVLLERGDFGHATSNNHFRMIHGGIRYLQHGDLYRVRESSHERSALLRIAPHQVHPLPIAIPTYGHGMKGKEILRAGTVLYDLLTADRNRGIPDPARQIPPGRAISRAETLAMFPSLEKEGLTGAVIFRDGQVYHPARLALAFLKSAVTTGAELANYVEVQGFLRSENKIVGLKACDLLSGNEFEIRARAVLNAAGPWAGRLLAGDPKLRLAEELTFSRDACFVVNRRLLGPESEDHALTVLGETSDPDALLSRGRRHMFIVPWQENTLVGVWHVVYRDDPDRVTVTEADLAGFIEEMNKAYPDLGLTLSDVSHWMAGLVLFGENEEGQKNLSYGKRSQLIDHRLSHGVEGLITMIGVRATTARGVAEKAVDLAFEMLGRRGQPSRTTEIKLHGGDFERFSDLVAEIQREAPPGLPEAAVQSLAHNYGTGYKDVLTLAKTEPALAGGMDNSRVTGAEVVYAVRDEMAVKLADVVFRRTDLGNGAHPGSDVLETAASLMARELGWDQNKVEAELDDVDKMFLDFAGKKSQAQTTVKHVQTEFSQG